MGLPLQWGPFLGFFNFIPLLIEQKGATAIEYGMIGAAISVAIGLSLFLFGDQIQAVFQNIVTIIANVNAEL